MSDDSALPQIPLATLTGDVRPLRDAFNRDVNNTRLLLLLSPT